MRSQISLRGFMGWGLACLLVATLCFAVSAQQQLNAPRTAANDRATLPVVEKSNTTIRVNSNLVLIPVTITDKGGKAITGLEQEHFTIFEGNAQQKITHFAAEDAPSSIGIVIDTSDSMKPTLRRVRDSVNALLRSVHPDSEFFLETFSNRAEIRVPLTSHVEEIRNYLENLRADGGTALLDGVRVAMGEMKKARYLRKAIVIVSDGEDNSSHWTVNELKTAVCEQDIVIYSIAIHDPAAPYDNWRASSGPALLRDISNNAGGCMFPVGATGQIPDIANKIGSWLRNQYVLGYVPDRAGADGTYRKVEVKVARPKGYPRFHAVWRQGYYLPKE
jgi:Ca-activated chloride channel homolog